MKVTVCLLLSLMLLAQSKGQSLTDKEIIAEYFVAYSEVKSYLDTCIDVHAQEVRCRPTKTFSNPRDIGANYHASKYIDYLCYEIFWVADLSAHGGVWQVAVNDLGNVVPLSGFGVSATESLFTCNMNPLALSSDSTKSLVERTIQLTYGGHPEDVRVVSIDEEVTDLGLFGSAIVEVTVDGSPGSKVSKVRRCIRFSIPKEGVIGTTECVMENEEDH